MRDFRGNDIQVLQIPSGERNVGDDLDLSISGLGDLDGVAKVANAALNLDPIVQELLEGGYVEDLVVGWLGTIDDILIFLLQLALLRRGGKCHGPGRDIYIYIYICSRIPSSSPFETCGTIIFPTTTQRMGFAG